MASDSKDTSVEGRLDLIADKLETNAGIDPGALRDDRTVPAVLLRIAQAVEDGATFIAHDLDAHSDTVVATPVAGQLLRYDGTTWRNAFPPVSIQFAVQDPDAIKTHTVRATKSALVWYNDTGRTLTISRVRANVDVDNYTFLLFKSNSETDTGTANDVLLVTVPCSSDGTGGFYADITSFTVATVEAGKWIIFEHSSGSADALTVAIYGSLS